MMDFLFSVYYMFSDVFGSSDKVDSRPPPKSQAERIERIERIEREEKLKAELDILVKELKDL